MQIDQQLVLIASILEPELARKKIRSELIKSYMISVALGHMGVFTDWS